VRHVICPPHGGDGSCAYGRGARRRELVDRSHREILPTKNNNIQTCTTYNIPAHIDTMS
jgi:hypothetical protein